MAEINDIAITQLPSVLRKETLMQGHWGLVEDADARCRSLESAGIARASDLFDLSAKGGVPGLSRRTRVPGPWIDTLHNLLMHHRYKAFSVAKVDDVGEELVQRLMQRGWRRTDVLIGRLISPMQRRALAEEVGVGIERVEKLARMLDLTRKPGIKQVKAVLFIDAGIGSLSDLGKQQPECLRKRLEDLIRTNGLHRAVPTPKEMESDVCWARVYPVVMKL